MKPKHRSHPGRAFTLVELLTVIGVIALLISVLLPALAKARAAAVATQCASNIRQIATAALGYSGENRGYYPIAHEDILTTNLLRWIGKRAKPTDPFDFSHSPLRKFLGDGVIRKCPAFDPQPGGFEAAAGGYGYNSGYIGSSIGDAGWNAVAASRPAMVTQIRRPAETLLFADSAMAVSSPSGVRLIEYAFAEPPTNSFGPTSPSVHFRHRGRANIAWADGHVSSEPMAWTWETPNIYGADNRASSLGYIGPRDNTLFDRQ